MNQVEALMKAAVAKNAARAKLKYQPATDPSTDAAAAHRPRQRPRRPDLWYARRIDQSMVAEVGFPASARPRVFVSGPTSLVESASQLLLELGTSDV